MSEPSLTEIISEAVSARLLDVMTALPGRVESYDRTKRVADVTLCVRRAIHDELGDVQHEEVPAIPNVPVQFPNGGGTSITWDLAKGDFVLLLFCSWSIGQWRETGEVSEPVDLRRHSLGNPIALAGVLPKSGTLPTEQDVLIIEAPMVKVGASADKFVALANKVLDELNDIRSKFDTHTHNYLPGPGAAVPSLVPNAPMGGAQPVACSKLKSE